MSRGRGRPKKTAPSSPASQTNIAEQAIRNNQDADSTKHQVVEEIEVVDDDSSVSMPETLIPKLTCDAQDDPKEERKLWIDVLNDNRNPAKGMAIEYVQPTLVDGKIEIAIEEEDIVSEKKFWENALVMYVLGGELSMNGVKQFITKAWNFVQLPAIYYYDDGYFLLKFNTHKDMDDVMLRGPYTVRNMPMLLREWKPGFNLKQDMLRTLPIWIQLPQLPLHLWGARSLGKIGSALGKPITTDECTAKKYRVSYARILVEVDVTQKLPNDITIRDSEGKKLKQPVHYEWKPMFCDKCQKFGHHCEEVKAKKVWQMKSKQGSTSHAQPKENSTGSSGVKGTNSADFQANTSTTVLNLVASDDIGNVAEYTHEWSSRRKNGKLKEIGSRLLELRPTITILIETRVKQVKARNIRNKLRLQAIYALNKLDQRRTLWTDIECIHGNQHGPWVLLGDFNNVLKAKDRVGGNLVTESEYEDLAKMMRNTGTFEKDSTGDYYTWSNKQTDGMIYSRIDRVLGNVEWFQDNMDTMLQILPPSVSDHALLCLADPGNTAGRQFHFKFSNCLTDLEEYHSTVSNS
ncbi:hypothetical protein HKD37_16G044853 [Glycine soja]